METKNEKSNLVDFSGAKIETETNRSGGQGEVKLNPLFFLSKESHEFIKLYGSPVTNRQVEASFNAWMELPSKYQAELNFLLLVMPR